MKKSLSLLVAIAMVFSMFAAVASAAEETKLTTEQKYEELVKAGLFEGYPDGEAHLDKEMTRAQASKIVALLTGYSEGVEVKDAGYTDLVGAGWATDYINYATQVGILEGKGNNKFDPSAQVTVQQLATIAVKLAKQANVEVPAGEEVEGKVDAWAADAVASAIAAGLLAKQDDYTVNANRGVLVEVVYSAKQIVEQVSDVSAAQTGAKQVTVKLNKAVDDSKVKFAVKNGAAKRDVDTAEFSADKKTVVLNLTSKLLDGASSVTVSGVAEKDLVADFTAAADKVTEIKFMSDKLPVASSTNLNQVSTAYKVVNQYGEDVTKTAGGSLTFQIGKDASYTATNGILTITGNNGLNFYYNETVYVTAILNMGTYGLTASQAFTVSQPAHVDSVKIDSVYHPTNKDLMTNNVAEFMLLVDALDQYGNKVSEQQFRDGVFAIAQNVTLFTVDAKEALANQGPNNDKFGIPFKAPASNFFVTEGTNKVTLTTLFGQKTDSIDVPVKKASTLTTFTLQQPENTVAVNEKVKIPFVAYDQDGKEIKSFNAIKDGVIVTPSAGTLTIGQNYATKEAYIEWTAPNAVGPQFITSNVKGTPNTSQIQVSVGAEAKAEAVAGLKKDVATSLLVGGALEIDAKHIVVKDQHSRDMDATKLPSATYELNVSLKNTNNVLKLTDASSVAANKVNLLAGKAILEAQNKGTQTLVIELVEKATNKVISSHESTVITVVGTDGIQADSYAVELPEKISDNGLESHGATVKVTAKRPNGQVVTLHADAYAVQVSSNLQKLASGKVAYNLTLDGNGDPENAVGQGKTQTGVVRVTVFGTDVIIDKDLVISGDKLVATTLEQKDLKDSNGDVVLAAKDLVVQGDTDDVKVISEVFKTLKIKDQYGVEMANDPSLFSFVINSFDGENVTAPATSGLVSANVSVAGISEGKGYTVTFTANDTLKSIKVKVVANS